MNFFDIEHVFKDAKIKKKHVGKKDRGPGCEIRLKHLKKQSKICHLIQNLNTIENWLKFMSRLKPC